MFISSIAGILEESLLPTARDSIGARLLKKMGWRLGQGIGPRVTWRQRKLQDARASSAPSAQDLSSEDVRDDGDPEANKHLYAPRDTKLLVFQRKDNSHGLGYVPGVGLNEIMDSTNDKRTSGPNLSGKPDDIHVKVLTDLKYFISWIWPRSS